MAILLRILKMIAAIVAAIMQSEKDGGTGVEKQIRVLNKVGPKLLAGLSIPDIIKTITLVMSLIETLITWLNSQFGHSGWKDDAGNLETPEK